MQEQQSCGVAAVRQRAANICCCSAGSYSKGKDRGACFWAPVPKLIGQGAQAIIMHCILGMG